MVPVPVPVPVPTMQASYQQALHSSALELKYSQSAHLVDIISKDEDIRRLRFDVHVLEDDNDELRGLLMQEEDRSDAFEKLVNENLSRAEEAEAQLQDLESDLRGREQELQALHAEKQALQHSSEDASAALTETLALTRELSVLKPELEHLKTQAASTEALMTEKLALQRQVTNIQCELENAKREAKRALAKRRNTTAELAQEEQMDDLKKELAKEKRARQRAEQAAEAAEGDMQQDDIRKQLAKERKARQKAEEQLESAQDATQVEDVRKDLLKEKKAKAKLEESLENLQAELEHEKKASSRAKERANGNAQADNEAEELRSELAKEKKERTKAQKAAQQASDEFEAQKTTLEDKLNQFRTKLKSTKEKLKDAEAQLVSAREAAAAGGQARKAAAAPKASVAPKPNPKKRNATQMDPDATTLGTPGDGPVAKRGKKALGGVGDKSTFSITPFLNKTVSVIQDEDAEAEDENNDCEALPAAAKQTKKPLAQQPASKSNVPPKKAAPTQRKPKPQPALEIVTEENEPAEDVHKQGKEDAAPAAKKPAAKEQTLKIKTKTIDGPGEENEKEGKKKPKLRKSLVDFASFNPEPEVEKKKKRKLGGLGKTLFDEEAGDDVAAPAKRGLFGTKGFGLMGVGKKTGGIGSSFLGGSKTVGSTLLTAQDGSGFQFSPLKKARRNLDDTLRG